MASERVHDRQIAETAEGSRIELEQRWEGLQAAHVTPAEYLMEDVAQIVVRPVEQHLTRHRDSLWQLWRSRSVAAASLLRRRSSSLSHHPSVRGSVEHRRLRSGCATLPSRLKAGTVFSSWCDEPCVWLHSRDSGGWAIIVPGPVGTRAPSAREWRGLPWYLSVPSFGTPQELAQRFVRHASLLWCCN